MKDFVLKQRENLRNQIVEGGSVPETRVVKLTNSGELKMVFTQPLKIPNGTEARIKLHRAENRRRLMNGEAPVKTLVQVFAVKG